MFDWPLQSQTSPISTSLSSIVFCSPCTVTVNGPPAAGVFSSTRQVLLAAAVADAVASAPQAPVTLTFSPGQTTRTIAVTLINDTGNEAAENLFATFSGAVNATLSVPRAAVIIGASDNAGAGLPLASVDELKVDERDGSAVFRVYLNQASATTVTLEFATLTGQGSDAANEERT